jgi:hypothetical protein
LPVIIPGVAGGPGLTTTGKLCAVLVPQEFVAVTVIFPFCPAAPAVTVIEFVPDPAVINHPVGTVQLYEDAVATDVIV